MRCAQENTEEEYRDTGKDKVLPKIAGNIGFKTYFVSLEEMAKKMAGSTSARRSYLLKLESALFETMAYVAAALTALALISILVSVIIRALPSLSLEYFLTSDADHLELGAGIANAIVGSLLLSAGSAAVATPFAVGAAIFVKRYAKEGRLTSAFSFFVDVMSGTPSIILGIFAFFFLVLIMHQYTGGLSLISGIIALAILIMPVIERSTENAIDSVPNELEDASYALGATRFDTVSKITLPYAMAGIITGVVIGVGRAAEESAVVILSAGYSQFMPEIAVKAKPGNFGGLKIYPFQDMIGSLPQCVYRSFEFSNLIAPSRGFAAAFVLILIVMFVNMGARFFLRRRKIG